MQEFLKQLDAKKSSVVDLNFQSKDISCTDVTAVRKQLQLLNSRWDNCCAHAAVWHKEMQIALLHGNVCNELSQSLTGLAQWTLQADDQLHSISSSNKSNTDKASCLRVRARPPRRHEHLAG